MADSQEVYTYQAGQKITLIKQPDQFVVRALPDELEELGITDAEQVSSRSSRVTTRVPDLEPMMTEAREVAPTHHAYYDAETGEEFLITDRVFVTFRRPLTPEEVSAFAGRYGLLIKEQYSEREYLFQLTDHTGMNPVKLVVKMTEEEPEVEVAEHDLNQRASTYQFTLPTDPFYARQWHLHTRVIDALFDARASSRAEEAWQALGHFGSPEVVVGVTDDGCKLDHPDFNSPDKFAGWGYFQGTRLVKKNDVDAVPSLMYQTGSNHGTSCAGVIAGEVDATLVVGAAPGCRLLPIKWESSGSSLFISDSKMRAALDYVADKVDVLSNSWGSVPSNLRTTVVRNRIAELALTGGRRGRGIVFLWAAGNESCPINHTAAQEVPYTNGWNDSFTAWVGVETTRFFRNNLTDVPGVMHIAALASNAQRSHYSNYGTGITLCAPTSNSHRFQRLPIRGLGVTTATGDGGGVTTGFGGTSSATPLVAGVVALMISANPELTALDIVKILKRTASKNLNTDGYARTPPANFDPNPAWDVSPVEPFNRPDFTDTGDPEGTWSPWFGHGKVDAANAVAESRRLLNPLVAQPLRFTSNPQKPIPDDNPAGIADIINVNDAGLVRDVQAGVDITHTWIGDLLVTLTAPDGTAVALHERSGGDGDNIRLTYDTMAVPALATLANRSIRGNWTLQVQDLAAQDVGTLNSWSLEIGVTRAPLVAEDTASVQIPDNNPAGISRTLNLPNGDAIKDISVSVDITHTWIGDLLVTLTPPGGTPIRLHDRTGRDADNIIRAWTSQDTPALQALRGQQAGGTWQLSVTDLEAQDTGKLNRWKIEITV
ncbi:MAG TPA: proprotein convertase P-domain-containing protein [Pyrinomonadaceae bacterium]|nr:proprotein convertase P-domain-containing protein [Pyrinomonadaceae bacterium]